METRVNIGVAFFSQLEIADDAQMFLELQRSFLSSAGPAAAGSPRRSEKGRVKKLPHASKYNKL